MTIYKKFNETELSPFQARYGESVPDNTCYTNEFVEKILSRKTIRRFSQKPLPPGLLEKLIAVAQSSPTSSMLQTWSVIAIESKENRKVFFEGDNAHANGTHFNAALNEILNRGQYDATMECPLFLIWLVDRSIINAVYDSDTIQDPELKKLQPVAKEKNSLLTYELSAIIDATIAAQTFVLSAESVGLGTMYCGALREMDINEHFNIPKHALPIFGICVGYPLGDYLNVFGGLKIKTELFDYVDKPVYTKPRLPQALVLHREEYKTLNFNLLAHYNDLMKEFYKTYSLKYDWFNRCIKRSIGGKLTDKVKQIANKAGFFFR
jgi:nitroreductase